jgi:integral membrane protein
MSIRPTQLLLQFRRIALLEGISLLILLFIAMPLKYFMDLPLAVKYFGWIHGILFIVYVVFLLKVWIELKWKFQKVVLAFLASIFPFGTFLLDKKLKEDVNRIKMET